MNHHERRILVYIATCCMWNRHQPTLSELREALSLSVNQLNDFLDDMVRLSFIRTYRDQRFPTYDITPAGLEILPRVQEILDAETTISPSAN